MPRKKINIDEKLVKNYASLGASNTEIAHLCNCSEGTIRNRFYEILTKERANRKIKLRQMLWKSAESGNVTAQIFLSKNILGMSDRTEQIHIDRKKEMDELIVLGPGEQSSEDAVLIG